MAAVSCFGQRLVSRMSQVGDQNVQLSAGRRRGQGGRGRRIGWQQSRGGTLSGGDVSGVIEGLSEKVKSGQLNSGVLFLVDTG